MRHRRRRTRTRTDAITTGIRTGTRTDTDAIMRTGLTTRHRRRACRAVFPTRYVRLTTTACAPRGRLTLPLFDREAAARRRKAPNNALNRRIKSIPTHGRAIIARTYLLRTGAYVCLVPHPHSPLVPIRSYLYPP